MGDEHFVLLAPLVEGLEVEDGVAIERRVTGHECRAGEVRGIGGDVERFARSGVDREPRPRVQNRSALAELHNMLHGRRILRHRDECAANVVVGHGIRRHDSTWLPHDPGARRVDHDLAADERTDPLGGRVESQLWKGGKEVVSEVERHQQAFTLRAWRASEHQPDASDQSRGESAQLLAGRTRVAHR